MPKPLHHIDPLLMHSLKMKLQSDLGVVVQNFTDCKRLSQKILENNKVRVSASTLYRLYFSPENQNHFYMSTLDLLVGLVHRDKSWSQFSEEYLVAQSKLNFIGFSSEKLHTPSLVERCFEYDAWQPLCQWFDDLSGDDHAMNSPIMLDNVGFHLRHILENHPQWEKRFYEKAAHFPFIKTSFFEVGTDPDFTLHHSFLSFQYYRQSLDNKTILFENDSLYIDSLECLYLFKKKDPAALTAFENLKSKYHHVVSLDNQIHIFNLTRLWILELHYHHMQLKDWNVFSWDHFFDRIVHLFPELDAFQKRVQRFMILDACIHLDIPKINIETLLEILEVQEIKKFNPTKLRYYLNQIDPNGTRWRKQFSHF